MLKRLLKSKLLGNTAIYALANVLNGAIPFLLLPILTRVFTPEEYGMVTLVSAVIAIMGAFAGLSAHGAVSVKYFDKTVDHPQFVGASLLVLAGSTAFILLFLVFAGDTISSWINLPKQWLYVAAIASAAQFVINIRLVLWQVQDQPIRYGLFQVSQTLFNLGLSLVLVFWAIWGWQGRAWGIALASIIFCVVAIASMQKAKLVVWKRNHNYERDVVTFGFPLIPHVLGGFVISMGDRFILTGILGLDVVGYYAVASQMVVPMVVLIDGFVKSYSVWVYKRLNGDVDKRKLILLTYGLFLLLLSFALMYTFFAKFAIEFLVGDKFSSSVNYLVYLSFSAAFTGMYYLVGIYISYMFKTKILSAITLVVSVLHFFICSYLVTLYGIEGAAITSLISNILMFLFTWILASKVYPMGWFNSANFSFNR